MGFCYNWSWKWQIKGLLLLLSLSLDFLLWGSFGHTSFIPYPTPDNLTLILSTELEALAFLLVFFACIKSIFQIVWWLWNKIIFLIDTTITWLTLPLFYFLVLTPFALLLRAIGKADMKHPNKKLKSYWKDTDQPSSAKQYFRQF